MKGYYKKNIFNSLKKAGIKKGDIIFVNHEIYKFGKYLDAKKNEDYFNDFYNILKKTIGKNGTMCMNTYTFNTLRKNERFVYENYNCTSGKLSELILKDKKSIRSKHPVFSVSAVGKYAKYICQNNSYHNYGFNSPYCRFIKCNGKILNLGMDPWQNPFNHVAEFKIGVPYYYNKYTKVNYYLNKKKKYIIFSSFVRFLNFKLIERFDSIKLEIKKKKIVKKTKLGEGYIFSMNANKYLHACLNVLSKNQFAFIDKKTYKKSISNNNQLK